MYYILEHGGLLLVAAGIWSSEWNIDESKAMRLWNPQKAEELRERFGGCLLSRTAAN